MLSRFHLIPERNGRTDGRTDRFAISISRVRASVCWRAIIIEASSLHNGESISRLGRSWKRSKTLLQPSPPSHLLVSFLDQNDLRHATTSGHVISRLINTVCVLTERCVWFLRCLSVRLSVTFVYRVEKSWHTYLQTFFTVGQPHHSSFSCQTLWQYSDWTPKCGRRKQGMKNRDSLPISRFISEMIQDMAIVTV